MLIFRILALSALVAFATAAPVLGDPGANNPNTHTRTLVCDNGRAVDATFAGFQGSNFNVTIDQSVFVYKSISIFSPSTGETFVDDRGIEGFDAEALTTCRYTTPGGNQVTVIGFFTPRA